MGQRSVLDAFSPCLEGTMINTPMPYWSHVKVVIHTDVAFMNVPSIGGGRYFATFIDEARHGREFHMKSEDEAAERLKRQAGWIEGQSRSLVNKILLDCEI